MDKEHMVGSASKELRARLLVLDIPFTNYPIQSDQGSGILGSAISKRDIEID